MADLIHKIRVGDNLYSVTDAAYRTLWETVKPFTATAEFVGVKPPTPSEPAPTVEPEPPVQPEPEPDPEPTDPV